MPTCIHLLYAGRGSPNSLLPTHISAFGDGVDLAAVAAVTVPPMAACLPTHISEFGEDDGGEKNQGSGVACQLLAT